MKLPNLFINTIKKKKLEDEQRRKIQEEKELKEAQTDSRLLQNLEQKIEISEKIFEWRNELLATDVGYEFILKGSLWIYHGG